MSEKPAPSNPTTTAIEVDLGDLEATRALGEKLAGRLRVGDILRLEGDLGAGKSELARAIIQARAGSAIDVPSPTFTLVQHYPLEGLNILHTDLYRIGSPEEIFELGIIDALDNSCILVEWPENADELLPMVGLQVRLFHLEGVRRRCVLEALDASWCQRIEDLKGQN